MIRALPSMKLRPEEGSHMQHVFMVGLVEIPGTYETFADGPLESY